MVRLVCGIVGLRMGMGLTGAVVVVVVVVGGGGVDALIVGAVVGVVVVVVCGAGEYSCSGPSHMMAVHFEARASGVVACGSLFPP